MNSSASASGLPRLRDGIPLDPATWRQLLETATRVGVSAAQAEELVA